MFTENTYKGVLKCDGCNFQQQVICTPHTSVKYNFHQVEAFPLIQPMLETTKDKPFIKAAAGSVKLQLCDSCYSKLSKVIQEITGMSNV